MKRAEQDRDIDVAHMRLSKAPEESSVLELRMIIQMSKAHILENVRQRVFRRLVAQGGCKPTPQLIRAHCLCLAEGGFLSRSMALDRYELKTRGAPGAFRTTLYVLDIRLGQPNIGPHRIHRNLPRHAYAARTLYQGWRTACSGKRRLQSRVIIL